MKHVYTITKEDIGKRFIQITCPCCHSTTSHDLLPVLGIIIPIDVGKRIFEKNGILWVDATI